MTFSSIDVTTLVQGSYSRGELWKRFLLAQRTRFMAEFGVWKGDFAEEILKAISHIEKYYMIDPWANLSDWNKPFNVAPETFDDVYREMDAKTAFSGQKRIVLRGRTKEVACQIPDESLDFVYINCDHTLRGIAIDLITMWPKLKSGGFIGGDDFTTTPWQHDKKYEPTMVCPFAVYFAESMNMPITALEHGQFLIEKNTSVGFSFSDTTGLYCDLSLNKLSP